ncbi:hypothetical protein [Cohnella thermotolerans]|nr:hypothetical protein [Cohnella thermotolerans]
MKQTNRNESDVRLKDIPDDVAILGPEYDFWLNEKDAIYDELYKDEV